jgi:hypothetical protein
MGHLRPSQTGTPLADSRSIVSENKLHFILSAPRSGSTWLATALNFHPQLFATEQRLLGRFCEIWRNNDGTTAPRITFDSYARAFGMHYFYPFLGLNYEQFVESFQAEFAQFMINFARRRSGKQVVVDKVTPYPGTAKFVVEQIHKQFPKARIVKLVRDGRDVLTSGTFDWLLKDAMGTARYDFFVNPRPGMKLTRFFDEAVIGRWAANWLETVDSLPLPADLIKFELMKSDLPGQLRAVFRAFGVEDRQELAETCASQTTFRKMAGREAGVADPLAKVRKGIVGDWRNYFTRADGQRFVEIAGRGLVELGYEPDDRWVDSLPEKLDLKTD